MRRITIAFGFLLTLAAVDFAVRSGDAALDSYNMDRIARKLAVLESRDPPPSIVIFGSSRTAYAMVPEEFERATGLPAFNFGIPASKVVEWRLIARQALERVRPRLIVLGVNASAIRADYRPTYAAWSLFEMSDFLEYTLANGWSNRIAADFLEHKLMQAWPTYARNHELKFWVQEQLAAAFPKHAQQAWERRELVAEPCPPDGFDHPWLFQKKLQNLQQQIDAMGDENVAKASTPDFVADGTTMMEFDRLLVDLTANRVPVVVCYIPNSPRTEARWLAIEPRMKRAIADACNRHGAVFVDATPTDRRRQNGEYVDECHAGLALAREISRHAAGFIASTGVVDRPRARLASGHDEDGGTP